MTEDTGFVDKTGKPIHVGDILQHRLNSKNGGDSRRRVVKMGKRYKLALPDDDVLKYGGFAITKEFCQRSVIIDRAH